jgi:hypothetical protein
MGRRKLNLDFLDLQFKPFFWLGPESHRAIEIAFALLATD